MAVIHAEIAGAHKLESGGVGAGAIFPLIKFGGHGSHSLFHLASGEDGERFGVQAIQEVLIRPVGLGIGEKVIIEAHLGVQAVFRIYPVERCTLDLAAVSGVAAPRVGVVFAENFGDMAAFILDTVLYDGSVTAETASAAKTVSLLVPEGSLDGFMDLHSGAEKLTMPAAGETLLNNALAEALGVGVGDTVTLRDGDMRALTVTVAGVFDNYVSNYAIVTPETCQSQWGSVPGSKTAFVSVNDTTDDAIHAASAQMLDLANVSAVTVNIDIRDRVATMMSVLDYIVWMVTVCAGALAFIVLYNLTNININERIREIATIKVLGFYPSETASYVFRENNTLVFLGMLLGLPLGKWLHAYVISQIKVDMIAFDVRIAPMSVVYSLLLTVLFAAIVDFVMYFRLRRISMAESLKSIE